MKPLVILGLSGIALLALAILTSGTDPFGRVLVRLGLPETGAHLIADPGLKGQALFKAQRYADAQDAFATAGDGYNRGLAAAWAGDYATALIAWEGVLAETPNDREARANHTLITALIAGVAFDAVARPEDRTGGVEASAPEGQGKARAASTGDDATDPKTAFWMPEVTSEGLRRVPKIFDAQYIAANERWLATLEDQPGAYLRARLSAEQKARNAAGTALPTPEDPR